MTDALEKRRAAARTAVLRYVGQHPQACDTVEGIGGWWLPEEGVTEGRELVLEVLEELVGQEALWRVTLPDGSLIYGGRGAPGAGS